MRSEPFMDGISLRAPNPRAAIRPVPAKPVAMQGLHNPRKLAGAIAWGLSAWILTIALGFTLLAAAIGVVDLVSGWSA